MNSSNKKQEKCEECNAPLSVDSGVCKKCGHLNFFGSKEERTQELGGLLKLLILFGFLVILYLNQKFGPFDIKRPW